MKPLLHTNIEALALAVWLLGATGTAVAAEDDAPPTGSNDAYLAGLAELNAIRMSIVDEKLALSLAVETQVQLELTEFALKGLRHDEVRRLTEKKNRLYRRLLNTLDELTAGRSQEMLAQAERRHDQATAPLPAVSTTTAAAGGATPVGAALTVLARTAPAADSDDDAPDAEPVARVRTRSRKGGGLSSVLQGAATKAILRVRLEIADEYAALLRAELAAAPPEGFDRCYMDIEVFNQMQVLSMLRVFEAHASSEFAAVLHQATAEAEGHVAESKQIAQRMPTTAQVTPVTIERLAETADTAKP